MELGKFIKTTIGEYLNEGINYSNSYLRQIIDDFFIYIEEFEYKKKFNMCDVFIYEFINYIQDEYNITDWKIYQLNHYNGNIKKTEYEDVKRTEIYHIMVRIGSDKFIDLTPEQFGIDENYMVYNKKEIENLFSNINEITISELKSFCRGKLHI